MAQRHLVKSALRVANTGQSISAYLPAPLANQVIDYIREINVIRKLIPSFNMPQREWRKPKKTDGMSAYYIPDGVTATLTGFSASTVKWVAKKIMAFVMLDEEAIEDSQPDVIQQVLRDFADAVSEAEEYGFLQGDTSHTATAQTPEAATTSNWYVRDPRLAFDGIFPTAATAAAATPVAAGGAIFDENMVNEAIYNLGKYGRNKARLFGLVPSDQAAFMRQNDQLKQANISGLALSSLITGLGSAEEGNGLITSFYGVKQYEVPLAPAGEIVIMRKDSAEIGDRRMIKMENEKSIESDQRKFVTSERIAFGYNRKDSMCLIDNLYATVNFANSN